MTAAPDVLLVEDERVVREAVTRILRPEGYAVECVEDVAGALAQLRKAAPKLVVCDLMLPGFSGFDLLERVVGERPTLPVVLITGYATIENALAAFKKGAFDFLPKPFDVSELLGVVRRALAAVARGAWRSWPPPGGADGAKRFLGQHAWVELAGERASFGLAESWPGLVGEIRELRLPRAGDRLAQGLACAELASADGSVHRVWAPLSGLVLESNPALPRDPDLLNRLPFTAGWLARFAPSDPAAELDALTLRATEATPATVGAEKEKRWSS